MSSSTLSTEGYASTVLVTAVLTVDPPVTSPPANTSASTTVATATDAIDGNSTRSSRASALVSASILTSSPLPTVTPLSAAVPQHTIDDEIAATVVVTIVVVISFVSIILVWRRKRMRKRRDYNAVPFDVDKRAKRPSKIYRRSNGAAELHGSDVPEMAAPDIDPRSELFAPGAECSSPAEVEMRTSNAPERTESEASHAVSSAQNALRRNARRDDRTSGQISGNTLTGEHLSYEHSIDATVDRSLSGARETERAVEISDAPEWVGSRERRCRSLHDIHDHTPGTGRLSM